MTRATLVGANKVPLETFLFNAPLRPIHCLPLLETNLNLKKALCFQDKELGNHQQKKCLNFLLLGLLLGLLFCIVGSVA